MGTNRYRRSRYKLPSDLSKRGPQVFWLAVRQFPVCAFTSCKRNRIVHCRREYSAITRVYHELNVKRLLAYLCDEAVTLP